MNCTKLPAPLLSCTAIKTGSSPQATRECWLTRYPTARLTVLTGCGHQLFTDQPEMGAKTVLDFLASVDAAGPEGGDDPSTEQELS